MSVYDDNVGKYGFKDAGRAEGNPIVDVVKDSNAASISSHLDANKRNPIQVNDAPEPKYQTEEEGSSPKDMMATIAGAVDFDPMDEQSVMMHQDKLNKAGYTDDQGRPLKVDGRFGPRTALANAKIQQDLDTVTAEISKEGGAGEGPLGQQAKDDVGMGGGNLQGNLLGIGRQFKENGGNGHGH